VTTLDFALALLAVLFAVLWVAEGALSDRRARRARIDGYELAARHCKEAHGQ
jgi:hypothetical protein